MGTLKINARHLTSETLAAELTTARLFGEDTGEIISDAAAVTIAADFQSPVGSGVALAALASGAETTTAAVMADVDAELGGCDDDTPEDIVRELRALLAWVESKVTVHYVIGWNIAGYMPTMEPMCFRDDWNAAAESLADEMRDYADSDDESTQAQLWDIDDASDGDAPAMRATVDAILRDDAPREYGKPWGALVEDGTGYSMSFWLAVAPADECDHDDADHNV